MNSFSALARVPGILDRFAFGAALFTTALVAFRLTHPVFARVRSRALGPVLACTVGLMGCGKDADETFAGMSSLVVGQPDGIGYRLRYLDPPWERVDDDPLVRGLAGTTVQFGALDKQSAVLSDLVPSPRSSRVLEIDRSANVDVEIPGVITYPKYRLEVSILRCDQLGVQVAQMDSCAKTLNRNDVNGRTGVELNTFFGQDGRTGTNENGQPYYEFMSQDDKTLRYRRVVYYETAQPLTAIRLGFEANPPLSELEVTQMINAFEVLDDEFVELALNGDDAAPSSSDAGTTP
jgi:hypothetical protein